VFSSARVVVEVRGCFWHQCPLHGTMPKANKEWWQNKLARNTWRDLDTANHLIDAGWTLVVVWEHDDPSEGADRIESALQRDRR
jgi:DNA mismatch endonuclease (patch repair protein)